jgi:mono/diheme cytochrome c family protein
MRRCEGFLLIGVVVGGCVASEPPAPEQTGTIRQSVTLDDRIAACAVDQRVVAGVVTSDTCVGADLFLRETFNGNGRSCATCHPVGHNFAIDPAFISQLPSTDPLFVAERNAQLAGLEKPAIMRQFGLILENVDGFAPDPTTHFVLRSVPHTLSLATSVLDPPNTPNPPANRTGWSGDGAPGGGALRDFQTGAITQHYTKSLARVAGTDFRLATSGELDRIDRFMRQLGRLNELNLTTVVMADAGAEAGRQRFLTVGCNACHGNAGANASFGGGGNRNFNTGVESARNSGLASFPRDGGFLASPTNADGSFGDKTFNAPPLIEAADTGPFFHTATTISGASAHNVAVATSIEEAIAFYDTPAFNNSPSGLAAPINLTAQEIDNIGRFLRGLNAEFNIAIASRRVEAVGVLLLNFIHDDFGIRAELMRLAAVEAQDALRVLSEVPNLNPTAQNALSQFIQLAPAFEEPSGCPFTGELDLTCTDGGRDSRLDELRSLLATARNAIGTNMTFQIGDGLLMF